MVCPNCNNDKIKILSDEGSIKRISCQYCSFEGYVNDMNYIITMHERYQLHEKLRAEAEKTVLANANVDKEINSRLKDLKSSLAISMRSDIELEMSKKHSTAEFVYEMNENSVLDLFSPSFLNLSASAFLITADGFAVTNAHCVEYKDNNIVDFKNYIYVVFMNRQEKIPITVIEKFNRTSADRISGDTNNDLALIKLDFVPNYAKPCKLGNASCLKTGEEIFLIGSSLGYGSCITSGIISSKTAYGDSDLFYHDAKSNAGNSGSAVFNSEGAVIAIHAAHSVLKSEEAAAGLRIAISVDRLKYFLKKYNLKLL